MKVSLDTPSRTYGFDAGITLEVKAQKLMPRLWACAFKKLPTHDLSIESKTDLAKFRSNLCDAIKGFEAQVNHFALMTPEVQRLLNKMQNDFNYLPLAEIEAKYSMGIYPEFMKEGLVAFFATGAFQNGISLDRTNTPNYILDEMLPGGIVRNHYFNELIKLKRQARAKGVKPDFNCIVIGVFDLIDELVLLHKQGVDGRYYFMVQNGPHYTGIDISLTEDGMEAVVLDAANDPRMYDVVTDLKRLCKKVTVIGAPEATTDLIQFDKDSCGYFAFDHLANSSKDEVFHELCSAKECTEHDGVYYIPWHCMPARYLRNIQSYSTLEKMLSADDNLGAATITCRQETATLISSVSDHLSKKNLTFLAYARMHSTTVLAVDKKTGGDVHKTCLTGMQEYRQKQNDKVRRSLNP